VAAAGLTLLDSAPGADPEVVLLFALFHDSKRFSDGHDPEHGARAAKLARELRGEGRFDLDDARMGVLEDALVRHDRGETTPDPTVGCCWDSDRLTLPRVWRRPDPALLSTAAARRLAGTNQPNVVAVGRFVWPAVFLEYAAKTAGDPVYLRFGGLPEGGRSAVGLFGLRELAVSVYPASRRRDGAYVLDFRRLLFGVDTRYLAKLLWEGRPLYLVEGRRVGIGGMGEPVLEDARIAGEARPSEVGVLPGRERFEALLGAWRAKRRGEDPGPLAFLGPQDPEERPFFPFAAVAPGGPSFGELVEAKTRELAASWGLLEAYDEMKAEQRREQRRRGSERDPHTQALGWRPTPTGATDPNRPSWRQQPRRKGGPWT